MSCPNCKSYDITLPASSAPDSTKMKCRQCGYEWFPPQYHVAPVTVVQALIPTSISPSNICKYCRKLRIVATSETTGCCDGERRAQGYLPQDGWAMAEIMKASEYLGFGVDDQRWTPGKSAIDCLIEENKQFRNNVGTLELILAEMRAHPELFKVGWIFRLQDMIETIQRGKPKENRDSQD